MTAKFGYICKLFLKCSLFVAYLITVKPGEGGGGGTPIYGLYRYVPRDRVCFLRFSVLKWGITFVPFGIVFPV